MPSGKNPRSEKWFPALMGGFGVLMGFAAFVLLLDEHEKADSPHVFFFGLLAAALTSFVIESVRARAEGKDASAHPVSAGRVIGLLILLGLFEIFVIGSEALAKLVVAGHGIDFLQGIFSGGITSELVNLAQLALFGGLWVLLGAITAWAAAGAISISSPVNWRQALAFSMLSMLKGLVVVAGITLVYVCAVRLGYTAYVLAVHPEKYRPGFDVLANGHVGHSTPIDIVQFMATSLASGVEAIAHTGPWGGLGAIAAVASLLAALIFLASHKWVRQLGMFGFIPLLGLGGALLLLALGPFATNGRQFSQLLQVGFACAVIWLPPLIVLSFAAPWLRTPSHDPRIWGIVSAGVALILFVVTWVGLLHPLDGQFIALGLGILVFTAIVFMRGAELREYWPLVALTMGIATFEFGLGLQQLTFLNTFKSFALLQTSKLEADQTRAAGKGYAAVQTWRDEQSVDPATADLVARTGDLWNAGDNPRTALAAQSLLDTLEARRRHVFGQELHRICDLTGSSWLNALHADIAAYCEQAYGVLADPERTEALHMAVLTAKPRPATALAPLALELMAEPASPAGSQVGPEAPDSTKEA